MRTNLLVSGGPTHDLAATSAAVADLLEGRDISTTIVTDPAEAFALLAAAAGGTGRTWDLLTVNALRWRMDAERYAALRSEWSYTLAPADAALLDGFVRSGGGLLALHTAVVCFDADSTWHHLLGGSWNWERSHHPPLGPLDVSPTEAGREHPITRGLEPFSLVDEAYCDLDLTEDVTPLLTGTSPGDPTVPPVPLLWARPVGRGRVVTSLLGHDPESLAHPAHRRILVGAAEWATDAPSLPRRSR